MVLVVVNIRHKSQTNCKAGFGVCGLMTNDGSGGAGCAAVLGGQGVASALRNKPRTHIIFQRASSLRNRMGT